MAESLRVTRPGGRVLFSSYAAAFWLYTAFVPELERLVREGKESGDAQKASAAAALAGKLENALSTTNHQWYLNQMDPAEKERRRQQMEEFKQRYGQ